MDKESSFAAFYTRQHRRIAQIIEAAGVLIQAVKLETSENEAAPVASLAASLITPIWQWDVERSEILKGASPDFIQTWKKAYWDSVVVLINPSICTATIWYAKGLVAEKPFGVYIDVQPSGYLNTIRIKLDDL